MDNIILLFYTHSDYVDIAIPSLLRLKRYWPEITVCLCTNNIESIIKGIDYNFKYTSEYDDSEPFFKRIIPILNLIKEKYIIFNIDINVLVDRVDNDFFLRIYETMINKDIDQIRLFQSGTTPSIIENNIYMINQNILGNIVYYISLNSSLWKRESLLNLAENFRTHSWRCSECSEIQDYASRHFKNYTVITPEDYQVLGPGHLLSKKFPFIHMLGAGRWRFWVRQSKFILDFCNEYKIDLQQRGTFSCSCPDQCQCI